MQTIFVFVKCDLGKSYTVAGEAAERITEVSEVHSISGEHDLLIKCYLADGLDVGHFVTSRIQGLSDVKDTFTLIGFKAFS